MDSTEVLRALEAELRQMDAKRAELAKAIETIRRIIVVGNPATAPANRATTPTVNQPGLFKGQVAQNAIAFLRKVGRAQTTREIVEAIHPPGRDRHSREASVYSALKRASLRTPPEVRLAAPNTWEATAFNP